MKRSTINSLVTAARSCFAAHGWSLPPNARWDVTDFGLGRWEKYSLVLVNLAEEPEYSEKLIYIRDGMTAPAHTHNKKKEDIICRWGRMAVQVWQGHPSTSTGKPFLLPVDHEPREVRSGDIVEIDAGSRVTLVPGVYHLFYALTEECIIGEVSTANDDLTDNIFADEGFGRFPQIEEDEPPLLRLVSEK